ncbi:chromosome partitioning protein [Salinibacter ruber]|jgi:chromosome partitioning protein|uniref:ParA family partition ATPase n=1 Tax=Salinibacter ruber TaxID=146919 RepID=UPI002167DBF2|nr:ParA family partition ATPase [Salinibacter ruber]MCS3856536.1 chromosome partitioning protein [Salinibacter ruber]
MAYVIAVLNQKGGVGKSTLSTNLSTAYARRGRKTLLADADSQGTARNWRGTGPGAEEHGKAFPDVVGADTAEAIDTLTGDEITGAFDVVVIDGPPGVTEGPGEVTVGALKAADLVLLPVRPSGADLWATSDLAELVTTRQDATGAPDAAFVVTQADARTNVAKEISGALEELGIPALNARCGFRVDYTKALGKGVAVEDIQPGGKAAGEIEAIVEEIETRFHV